jgi:hypothetical protein
MDMNDLTAVLSKNVEILHNKLGEKDAQIEELKKELRMYKDIHAETVMAVNIIRDKTREMRSATK